MLQFVFTPQFITDLLIVALAAIETLRWRRAGMMTTRPDRGTTLVFWGCYAITLLALNATIPSPMAAAPQIGWIGTIFAACGLGGRIGVAWVEGLFSGSAPASRRAASGNRRLDLLGNLVLWVGAAAASENLIVVLTVTVAMLPATVLRNSAEKTALERSHLDQIQAAPRG